MRVKYFVLPAYCVAFLLIVFPLLDTALSVYPTRVSEVAWRFGATGLFSRALMTPMLGLLLAFGVALLAEHRAAQRVIAVLSGLLVLTLAGAVVLFTLDALQMRVQVRPEAKTAFDLASAAALAKYITGAVVALAFAIMSWKAASSRDGRVSKVRRAEESTLVVGTRAAT